MRPSADDRRDGPIDRRVYDLEQKYDTIIDRLDTIDATLAGITSLKLKIEGVLYFLQWVGAGILLTLALFLIRFLKG